MSLTKRWAGKWGYFPFDIPNDWKVYRSFDFGCGCQMLSKDEFIECDECEEREEDE
jgi:hypothetical protein